MGLDADFDKIPEKFKSMEFPQFEFNKWLIEETHAYASAFKLNIAFYEARGDQGVRELKQTMDYLRANYADVFLICEKEKPDNPKCA